MIAVDTNVLVYAHRAEFQEHDEAVRRLTALAEGPAPWGIPVFCIGEFVRVVTHRKILNPPSSAEQALAFVGALAGSPTFRILLPDETFVATFADAVRAGGAAGNLVFDAQIAAVSMTHGATLLTADRDFARFGMATEFLAREG